MIISRLLGGSCNQMFQYAAGRALADHLGTDLGLDRRYVADSTERGDCFAHFRKARFVKPDTLPPAKSDGFLRYGLWRYFGKNPKFCREQGLGYFDGFFDLPDNTYLHGYWQSQRYFGQSTGKLRNDLQMTTPLDSANTEMAARIRQTAIPVSVHVRRGDYLASGSFQPCSPNYYQSAVDTLHLRLDQPLTCFLFSNDPDWARSNLDLGHETVVVDLNDEKSGHFDLHLMSCCAHHVIANSTFSWWGAWLNANPDKQVIAPKNWFAKDKLSNPDICPPNWLRL